MDENKVVAAILTVAWEAGTERVSGNPEHTTSSILRTYEQFLQVLKKKK